MNPALMMAVMNAGRHSSNNNSNHSNNQNQNKEKQAELLLLEKEGISMRIEENQKIEVIKSYYNGSNLYGNSGWNATINGRYETFYSMGDLLETICTECNPKEMQVIPTKVENGRVSEIQIVLVVKDIE